MKPYSIPTNFFSYTSHGHVCGFYGKAILFESKERKQAHSKLCNRFRNAATGQKSASENRKCGRAKYKYDLFMTWPAASSTLAATSAYNKYSKKQEPIVPCITC
jgi:hypothetical protein